MQPDPVDGTRASVKKNKVLPVMPLLGGLDPGFQYFGYTLHTKGFFWQDAVQVQGSGNPV